MADEGATAAKDWLEGVAAKTGRSAEDVMLPEREEAAPDTSSTPELPGESLSVEEAATGESTPEEPKVELPEGFEHFKARQSQRNELAAQLEQERQLRANAEYERQQLYNLVNTALEPDTPEEEPMTPAEQKSWERFRKEQQPLLDEVREVKQHLTQREQYEQQQWEQQQWAANAQAQVNGVVEVEKEYNDSELGKGYYDRFQGYLQVESAKLKAFGHDDRAAFDILSQRVGTMLNEGYSSGYNPAAYVDQVYLQGRQTPAQGSPKSNSETSPAALRKAASAGSAGSVSATGSSPRPQKPADIQSLEESGGSVAALRNHLKGTPRLQFRQRLRETLAQVADRNTGE